MGSPMSSSAPNPSTSSWLLIFLKLLVSNEPKAQLLRIQLSVLITTVGVFSLLFLGSTRRFVRFGVFLKYLTKIIYVFLPISITYIMGLMHNASNFLVLYPFWACALIYAYGGVVTMTACDFSDNETTLQYFWRTIPLFFWTGWLSILIVFNTLSLMVLFFVLIFLYSALVNTKETLNAFYSASKSKGLPYVVEPTVRYMRKGEYIPNQGTGANPSTCRYLVWGNPMDDKDVIVTTEEIRQYVSGNFLPDFADREHLEDMCLSYALFKLILRRFADFPLVESSDPRTRHFIREELLVINDPEVANHNRIKRVFRIIEVELQFLFDFFYTKSHSPYNVSKFIQHLTNAGTLVFVFGGLPLFIHHGKKDHLDKNLFSIQYHGHSLEVGITRVVTIIFFLLEIWTIFNVWFSNQMMVRRLSRAVQGGTIETKIQRIWNVKDWFSRRDLFCYFFKPWQRQLGQYSFLESYTLVPKLAYFSWLGNFVKIPRAGQTGESSVELSTQVKQAIVTSLRNLLEQTPNGQPVRLSQGRAVIAQYPAMPLPREISQVCQLETVVHVILVWHIATCLCIRHRHPDNNDPNTDIVVATQLSNYCAYLVAFAPQLIPSHPLTTERLFDAVVKQAKRDDLIHFNMHQGNENVGVNRDVVDDPDEVVARGVALARRLMNEDLFFQNPTLRWTFLAEFWVELLLYLAPSDNVATHGEYLAKGGEFITHLWALLTHAGIVNRSINCPPMEN